MAQDRSFPQLLEALKNAPTAPDTKAAADSLAREVQKQGLQTLMCVLATTSCPASFAQYFCSDASIIDTLQKFAQNKKSGYERESAAIGYQYLASVIGTPTAPFLLPQLATIMDLYMDKGDVVRIAATAATKTILKPLPREATRLVFRQLEDILEKGKWKTKVGALDSMRGFVERAREEVGAELGNVLPKVELAMHDTKPEVYIKLSLRIDG